MTNQRLSVVIVAYDSLGDLRRCLPSLFAAGPPDLEVIIVDNLGDEDLHAWLQLTYPQVRLIVPPSNAGYAGGNNVGFEAATGSHILVLNPDTELTRGSIAALLAASRSHPSALVTPMLVQPDGSVNACGLDFHVTGIATCRGLGSDPSEHDGIPEVPLVSGAAFLAPKAVVDDLAGFDADYFTYMEDVDLSLRARLRGHRVVCATDAVVVHDYRASTSPTKLYYLERNRKVMLVKLFEGRTLLAMAPALVATELATLAYAAMSGPRHLGAHVRAWVWIVSNWTSVIRRRRSWQAARRRSDGVVLADAVTELPLRQLGVGDFARSLVDVTSGWLYRWSRRRAVRG